MLSSLLLRYSRERELLQAVGMVVRRVIADAEPAPNPVGKNDVDAGGEHSEVKGIVEREDEHLCLRQNRGVEELERAVSSGARSDDEAAQTKPVLLRNFERVLA